MAYSILLRHIKSWGFTGAVILEGAAILGGAENLGAITYGMLITGFRGAARDFVECIRGNCMRY